MRPAPAFASIVIGSAPDCDVVLDDPDVEARHAQIIRGVRAEHSLVDLGPYGGTRILRGTQTLEVRDGTLLRIDDAILVGGTALIWKGCLR